ncbi:MAG: hypothetical protein KJZ72_14665 [Anaerolineales bacterium]|nr:hypothetical protein [Anaerolineales bacterium]
MSRQSLHTSTSSQELVKPTEPIHLIQTAREAKRSRPKRKRDWEKLSEHRSRGYRVPNHLRNMVGEKHEKTGMRYSIRGIADHHMTTTSQVAGAMMTYALSELRAGKIPLEARPQPEGRVMRLDWSIREDAWAQDIPTPKPRKQRSPLEPKPLYISYRWGSDTDAQIKAVATSLGVTIGEVVVYLLHHAIQSYRSGRLHLHEAAKVVRQTVSPSW